MSVSGSSEAEVIESLLPKYQAEGYDVYINPSPSILPPFMQTYRPDAIALKKDRKIAIEVVGTASPSTQKITRLQSLFEGQNDWELRVFYAAPAASTKLLEVASSRAINDSIQSVIDLKSAGHLAPALLMAWATFEAVGRALLPDQFRRPQTPARLVEVLGAEGYITPEEADILRTASSIRNAVVHGQLDAIIDQKTVDDLVAILQTLARLPLTAHS
jgi:REase_AHJR-like